MIEVLSAIKLYAGYVLTIISLISFVVALIKAIKNKQFSKIKDLMIGFIEEAETLTCKNGQAVDGNVKKEIVLSKIRTICNNVNYKFDETTWSTLVDQYVEFTLKVNQREQDKEKLAKQEPVIVVESAEAQQ